MAGRDLQAEEAALAKTAMIVREFFEMVDHWIWTLPDQGEEKIMVRGQLLVAKAIMEPPLVSELLQAYLEGKFDELVARWTKAA